LVVFGGRVDVAAVIVVVIVDVVGIGVGRYWCW